MKTLLPATIPGRIQGAGPGFYTRWAPRSVRLPSFYRAPPRTQKGPVAAGPMHSPTTWILYEGATGIETPHGGAGSPIKAGLTPRFVVTIDDEARE